MTHVALCPSPTGWGEIVEISFKNSRHIIIQLVRHIQRDIRKHTLKKKQEYAKKDAQKKCLQRD
jgi:hypothetical protein